MIVKHPYIGQRVKIRDWDDMAAEHRILDGDIDIPGNFVSSMRQYCGRCFEIERISKPMRRSNGTEYVYLYGHNLDCYISNHMCEPVIEKHVVSAAFF